MLIAKVAIGANVATLAAIEILAIKEIVASIEILAVIEIIANIERIAMLEILANIEIVATIETVAAIENLAAFAILAALAVVATVAIIAIVANMEMKMITIAVANQKGGVAKSTTVMTLGSIMAECGYKTLLVDFDPQSSLTQGLGADASGRSIAEAIGDAQPGKLAIGDIIWNVRDNLDLAPSDIALSSSELGLIMRLGRENVLKNTLAKVAKHYDLAIIDCPPSLALLTINALVAAQGVLVPTLPAAADLRGLRLFLNTLDQVRGLNPALELIGVIVTQYDSRVTIHQTALESLLTADLPVWNPPVPRSIKVQGSQGANVPLVEYDPKSKPTLAYRELAKELEKWLNSLSK